MPFPATITTTANVFVSGTANATPFIISGNRYALLQDSGSATFCMFKSSDGGFTWSRMDQANEPNAGDGTPASTTDGGKIFIMQSDPTTAFTAISIFDAGSGTWSGTTTTSVENTQAGGRAVVWRSSDNSLVCFGSFNSLNDAGFQRTGFFIFDIGSLMAGSLTPNGFVGAQMRDWIPVNVILGNSMMHFVFFTTPQTSGGTRDISTQSIDGGNTLGTLQLIDTITDSFFSTDQRAFGDGITVAIQWQPSTNVRSLNAWQGASATTLSLSLQTLSTPDSGLDDATIVVNTTLGSVITIALTDNGTDGFVNDASSVAGGTFSAFTREFTLSAEIVFLPQAQPIGSTAWGMVFQGTNPLYAEPGGGPPPVTSSSYAYNS